jgi:hypothetical protein
MKKLLMTSTPFVQRNRERLWESDRWSGLWPGFVNRGECKDGARLLVLAVQPAPSVMRFLVAGKLMNPTRRRDSK